MMIDNNNNNNIISFNVWYIKDKKLTKIKLNENKRKR